MLTVLRAERRHIKRNVYDVQCWLAGLQAGPGEESREAGQSGGSEGSEGSEGQSEVIGGQ